MKQSLLLVLLISGLTQAQWLASYQMGPAVEPKTGLAGNGITDIRADETALWFGTGHGLSRWRSDSEGFISLDETHGLGRGSVSALWVHGDTLLVATATDTITPIQPEPFPKGTGISLSFDGGASWKQVPQPGPTPIQNVTYDIELLHGVLWITSWGGGVRKSLDWGDTWLEAAPDSFNFDPLGKLNHRGFSVIVAGEDLWVGTAGGINRSSDDGASWRNFNHTNQTQPISGNFIVALAYQKASMADVIWAATWKAEAEDEFYAVSFSFDGGQHWQTALKDEKAHNFAFDGDAVYVATDSGLFKSIDMGASWYQFPSISSRVSGERIYSQEVYSAAVQRANLWVGTADGLARTRDNGYSWDIFRSFQPTGPKNGTRTYAYPNPFSPVRHNLLDDVGHVRFQYNTLANTYVTVKVFDFAMELVTTVVKDKFRAGPGDYAEVWDGRNDYGDAVANGVYFYRVDLEGDGSYWGKVMIVN